MVPAFIKQVKINEINRGIRVMHYDEKVYILDPSFGWEALTARERGSTLTDLQRKEFYDPDRKNSVYSDAGVVQVNNTDVYLVGGMDQYST